MNIQMEDFYADAKNADILIYNSTIEGEISTLEELKQKNALFGDFRAVQDGNVYCTTNNFFQKSTAIGDFMEDLNMIFQDTEIEEAGYLKKLR